MSQFKKAHPFERRHAESRNIISKYPDRVPVICERNPRSTDIPAVDKKKYLVPIDLTIGQFIYIIRKRMALDQSKALFLFVNESVLVPTSALMQAIYSQYADADGFLYISYSGENTFGMGDAALVANATSLAQALTALVIPHNPHSM